MRQSRLNPRELAREGRRRAGRMRAWSGGRPDQATVLVEERLADGRYKVKRDGWPCSIYVPASPPGAKIPTPRRMPLLFENGNSQRPFLLWRARSPGFVLGPGSSPEVAFSPWLRVGANVAGRYWVSEGRLEPGVPPELPWTSGILAKAWAGQLGWANGSTYHQRDLESDATHAVEHDGEIVDLWSDGSSAWVVVEVPIAGSSEGYYDGEMAAREALHGGMVAQAWGAFACSEGWPPESWEWNWPDPQIGDAPPGSLDYREAWVAGFAVGWRSEFETGYVNNGCSL